MNNTHTYKKLATWKKKRVLRDLYYVWYEEIINNLNKKTNGNHVEIGSGTGNFKEYFPDVISTDIEKNPWIDVVIDASQCLPFEKNSINNFILIDVLHHLQNPLHFFLEAKQKLKLNGRIILLEPYISFFSYLIYKFFHPENLDLSQNIFDTIPPGFSENEAIPTLILQKYQKQFLNHFPELTLNKLEYRDFLLYLLTGGFSAPSLLHPALLLMLYPLEQKVTNLIGKFVGLRLFCILEKNSDT